MMNDRFSAQLRQHLLSAADERPGEGRLASIVEGVAVTRQRRPLVGRLSWAPRLAEPFSSAALRYGLIAAALVIGIVAAALAAGVGPTRPTDFEGTWQSTDPGDGSRQTLVVDGGTRPALHFEDDFATGAACANSDVKVFTMDGIGSIDGDRLDVAWPDGGGCGLVTIDIGPGSYFYDQGTDRITDRQGLTWTRLERVTVPPTSTPTHEPTLPSPTADPDCIDFDSPGTYTAPAGSLSLTVNVPRSAGSPWHGHRDRFDLMQSWCADERGGPGLTLGAELTRVYTDACAGVSVPVDSAAAAITAVSTAKGLEVVDQMEATVGGYSGTRFEITVSEAPNACFDQYIPISDDLSSFAPGLTFTLYVIDVDGKTLALAHYGSEDWQPAVTADLDAMLASMRIERGPAVTAIPPTPDPGPQCFDVPAGGTYRHDLGELSLAATVPAAAEFEWEGYRDGFEMAAMCHFGRPVVIAASVVSVVQAACDNTDGVEVTTPAAAVAQLTVPTGYSISSSTAATIAGYQATRFKISFDSRTCGNAIRLWDSRDIGRGTTIVYIVDVDGSPVGITITNLEDEAPEAQVAEAEAIVASMRVERP